jgi:putative tryptophan/tyrosine transport system substrate-binding protein
MIGRREFIAGFGAVAWPVVARAQQGDRMQRVGVLVGYHEDDPDGKALLSAFIQGLAELGWTNGRNLRIDYRASGGNADLISRYAAELLALAPDVVVAAAGVHVAALRQATRTVPIVFMGVIDPVGAGFVASLARPGGNATGFTVFEYGISGKWLQLLKEIAPYMSRVAVIRNPTVISGSGQLGALQGASPSFGVELTPIDVQDAGEIERGITAFAGGSNGALIVTMSVLAFRHRETIVALAARYRLPAVYPDRAFAAGGGLISYGPLTTYVSRRVADYVDRILKGEKPGDLPVQVPTKYETVINLKTAKALGLTIPETLLATADEVIQ